MPVTAISNHNGEVNKEARLIYVVDQKSGLPIFFNLIPGNIVDNSTLKHTINTLSAYDIDIEFIIMDAGYSSEANLNFLDGLNIPYITRMNANKNIYNDIVLNYGKDIDDIEYLVNYNDRFLFCKKIPYQFKEKQYFAYLIKDVNRITQDSNTCYHRYFNEQNGLQILKQKKDFLAKFVLISNKDFDDKQILNIYHTRLRVEQLFDLTKNNGSIIPGRVHSLETYKGHLMLSFLASVISLLVNKELKDTKLGSSDIFAIMRELDIDIYNSTKIVKVPVKAEKEVIATLKLQSPFEIETGELKSNYLKTLGQRKKVGRPKGKKNQPMKVVQVSEGDGNNLNVLAQTRQKKRGRPPKAENSGAGHPTVTKPNNPVKKRGRPPKA
jgi:transposase